ncbi:hypothetical protein Hanom_Chr14g01327781 [Helianthus anomalus]
MTTRTVDMDWRTRSLRVLPMFLLPALSFGSICIMGFRVSLNFVSFNTPFEVYIAHFNA